jgi:hypothetical protein
VIRRDKPRHLDAHLVPLEQALLHRADELEATVKSDPHDRRALIADLVAAEFRELAEELKHW